MNANRQSGLTLIQKLALIALFGTVLLTILPIWLERSSEDQSGSLSVPGNRAVERPENRIEPD